MLALMTWLIIDFEVLEFCILGLMYSTTRLNFKEGEQCRRGTYTKYYACADGEQYFRDRQPH